MKVKILVATHKKYWMPGDEMYLPIHVGAEGKKDESGSPLSLGYIKDNTGENISEKNKNFCELTGLYWAWKNLDADYIGLAHYRRHFTIGKKGAGRGKDKRDRVLTSKQLKPLLAKYDVILPKERNYYIETNYNQYVHAHNAIDLEETERIIEEKYPEYLVAYEGNMHRTSGHRFNMFIMKKELFDQYCEWLFDILFELEKRLDISDYSDYDARVFGFVSERLLDVWIQGSGIRYAELPYMFMESQNWIVKGGNFLKRKFFPTEK